MAKQSENQIAQIQTQTAASSQAAPMAAKVIINTTSRYVVKPNQHNPGGWLKSPAHFDMFRATEAALVDVATARNMTLNQVLKIRVARVEDGKKIYLYPTDDKDVDGLEIRRTGKKLTVNLVTFMAPNNLCVDSGYKERYELTAVGEKDSPVGAALVFDMTKPAERKLSNRRRSSAAAKAPAPQPPTTEL